MHAPQQRSRPRITLTHNEFITRCEPVRPRLACARGELLGEAVVGDCCGTRLFFREAILSSRNESGR